MNPCDVSARCYFIYNRILLIFFSIECCQQLYIACIPCVFPTCTFFSFFFQFFIIIVYTMYLNMGSFVYLSMYFGSNKDLLSSLLLSLLLLLLLYYYHNYIHIFAKLWRNHTDLIKYALKYTAYVVQIHSNRNAYIIVWAIKSVEAGFKMKVHIHVFYKDSALKGLNIRLNSLE